MQATKNPNEIRDYMFEILLCLVDLTAKQNDVKMIYSQNRLSIQSSRHVFSTTPGRSRQSNLLISVLVENTVSKLDIAIVYTFRLTLGKNPDITARGRPSDRYYFEKSSFSSTFTVFRGLSLHLPTTFFRLTLSMLFSVVVPCEHLFQSSLTLQSIQRCLLLLF